MAQFAMDGVWEESWCFDARQPPEPEALTAYLEGCTDLAFEGFFGDAFFGLRMTGERSAIDPFAERCLQVLKASVDGGSFLEELRRHFQLPAPGARPAFAEIGCVNAWQSVGALRLDEPAEALANFDDTWRRLQDHPLFHDTHHHKAIELAGEKPLGHWFALPIAEPEPPFRISPDLLRRALLEGAGGG